MKKILLLTLVIAIGFSNFVSIGVYSASTGIGSSYRGPVETKELNIGGVQVTVPEFVDIDNITNSNDISTVDEVQSIDLTKTEAQTQLVELPNGEIGSLTIAPEVSKGLRSKTLPAGTSYWKVYWYSALINLGYKITVSNTSSGATTITSYTDEWYVTFGPTVTGESFYRNFSKMK